MRVYKDSTGAKWREQNNGSYLKSELRKQEDDSLKQVVITLPLRYLISEFGPMVEVGA